MAEVLIISGGTGCYSDRWHPFADTSQCLANIISELGHDVTISEAMPRVAVAAGSADDQDFGHAGALLLRTDVRSETVILAVLPGAPMRRVPV